VVHAKEPFGLALGVGALEPRQAEGAGGEGLVGVGLEALFALFWDGGEDWVLVGLALLGRLGLLPFAGN
jgi:hypothetical protein